VEEAQVSRGSITSSMAVGKRVERPHKKSGVVPV